MIINVSHKYLPNISQKMSYVVAKTPDKIIALLPVRANNSFMRMVAASQVTQASVAGNKVAQAFRSYAFMIANGRNVRTTSRK